MKEIDTSGWGEFRIGELFDVVKGSRLRSVDRVDGEIPYIGATLFDNGYVQTIGNDENLHPGGVLTACYNGRATGVTFYQPEQFWATDDVNVLYPKFEMSEEIGLFIAPAIQSVGMNFGWESKWNLPDMIGAVIRLPVTVVGDPDWAYMGQTMRDVMTKQARELDVLTLLSAPRGHEVDTSNWGEFRVGELFEIAPTKAHKLTNDFLFDGGENPVVVNSSQNNGVGGFTSQELTEEPGAITFSDTTDAASIFYQALPFVGYPHVQAMRLHDGVECSGLAMLYVAGVFKTVASLQGYDYANKFTRVSAAQLVLKLPVTAAGDPDWDFMEQTMRDVMTERETALDSLQALAGV